MYRSAPAGFPPPPDPLLLVPGEGLRGLLVGRATAEDVLRELGHDCQVAVHDTGEVWQIDYDYDGATYAPSRPAQAARPADLRFAFGVLQSIGVGVYQEALRTTGGLGIHATRDAVEAVFGRDPEVLPGPSFHTLRYRTLGIELSISTTEGFGVSAITIFRAAR